MQKRRWRGVMLAVAILVGATAGVSPASSDSEATGSLVFTGRMNLSGPMPGDVPDVPSVPSNLVGSGETFPIAGGNETCGKNNTDGGIWSTHVPDPLVDEIGLCRGAGSLPFPPRGSGTWTMNVGTEPPDVCRGQFTHGTFAGGQVCSFTSLTGTSWSGRCEQHSGSGTLDVVYTGPLGTPKAVRVGISWFAEGGVAAVIGWVESVQGVYHNLNLLQGTLTFTPNVPCGTGDVTSFTVTGQLAWVAATV